MLESRAPTGLATTMSCWMRTSLVPRSCSSSPTGICLPSSGCVHACQWTHVGVWHVSSSSPVQAECILCMCWCCLGKAQAKATAVAAYHSLSNKLPQVLAAHCLLLSRRTVMCDYVIHVLLFYAGLKLPHPMQRFAHVTRSSYSLPSIKGIKLLCQRMHSAIASRICTARQMQLIKTFLWQRVNRNMDGMMSSSVHAAGHGIVNGRAHATAFHTT